MALEQLNVLTLEDCKINHNNRTVEVGYTPTVPNCSSGALIGLMILAKLQRTINKTYKIKVFINPGTHDQEKIINKQLYDKERVFAAFENVNIMRTINEKLRDSNEEIDINHLNNLIGN